VKTKGAELLEEPDPDRATAPAARDQQLREFYEGEHGRAAGDPAVAAASGALQRAWAQNDVPHMKVSWQAYPQYNNHLDIRGCFRCHNDELAGDGGSHIFTSCSDCHVVLALGEEAPLAALDFERGVPFYHFGDGETFERYEGCASCHGGGSNID
jgi:hypothetical protein